ncbi:MAG: hypothetical protein CMN57_09420 [Gammaproteobacteria bacterium]|nr:hypothetical protein [Gammaproteobacteria bacterium]
MATPAAQIGTPPARLSPVDVAQRYRDVRRHSEVLAAPLSPEDACVQSMPDASPAKWHLAHVTWFFETFVLEAAERDFEPHHPAFRVLFNSYYNGIGKQYPRPDRGLMTRPSLRHVMDYRHAVDSRMKRVIGDADHDRLAIIELGLHHEQQHQELLLMDAKHLLSRNPLDPAYADIDVARAAPPAPLEWLAFEPGLVEIGAAASTFHYDNESPRHACWLQPFEIASRVVTNGEYLEFVRDGGYRKPMLWLADGWAAVNAAGWTAPMYWREVDGEWFEFTLHGLEALDLDAPVCHVSHYEADAYAQWADARLPLEAEWEHAAAQAPLPQRAVMLHPRGVGTAGPFSDAFGQVWQWTRSAYLPYPGFRAAGGAVGEYNGKFMSGQISLRGSACITPAGHARLSYRNFFYPGQRWPFCGIRLARDPA